MPQQSAVALDPVETVKAPTTTMATTAKTTKATVEDHKARIVEKIQNILKSSEIIEQEEEEEEERHEQQDPSFHSPSVLHAHTSFPGISQLLPTLYLCGAGVALPAILDQLGISFIINVAPELPDTPLSSHNKPLYLRINCFDRPDVDLSVHFTEVADMIEEVRQNGGRTLVHCVAGVSRSATLCIAYLMRHASMSLREAYQHVKAIRPQIRPNSGFFDQLRRYEMQLRGTSSVELVYFESLGKEIPDVYEPEYRAMEDFYQRHRHALKRR